MTAIRFDFGALTLDAVLLDTPTAQAVLKALPLAAPAMTWGDEIYFDIRVRAACDRNARDVVTAGEIAYWPDEPAVAIGFGRTPLSRGDEIRLASPVNIFAKALGDVTTLRAVKPGAPIKVYAI